ncbi:MAG: preprotein translocase subunit SecG [Candidatus Stygibacter australis]|nr:preprotein translocase subunit SecG [Candidatus Stygibacter australis]MDP8321761.1 preprotein translocase subunit SecG [Candidatus Stygibacter australis]
MYTVLLVLHVVVAIGTLLVILVQSSKGNGLDSTLGGAASQVLGGQAAPAFLKKMTRILVAAFFIVCVLLAFQNNKQRRTRTSSAVQKLREQSQTEEVQPMEENAPLEEMPLELPAAAGDSI